MKRDYNKKVYGRDGKTLYSPYKKKKLEIFSTDDNSINLIDNKINNDNNNNDDGDYSRISNDNINNNNSIENDVDSNNKNNNNNKIHPNIKDLLDDVLSPDLDFI
jgi:hypothetical protein